MRISHGRARVEEHDAPEAGQLERSLPVFRHLRSEGSGMSRAELRDRDGKRKLCVHPPIRAVPSQRDAHHFQSASGASKPAIVRASDLWRLEELGGGKLGQNVQHDRR